MADARTRGDGPFGGDPGGGGEGQRRELFGRVLLRVGGYAASRSSGCAGAAADRKVVGGGSVRRGQASGSAGGSSHSRRLGAEVKGVGDQAGLIGAAENFCAGAGAAMPASVRVRFALTAATSSALTRPSLLKSYELVMATVLVVRFRFTPATSRALTRNGNSASLPVSPTRLPNEKVSGTANPVTALASTVTCSQVFRIVLSA